MIAPTPRDFTSSCSSFQMSTETMPILYIICSDRHNLWMQMRDNSLNHLWRLHGPSKHRRWKEATPQTAPISSQHPVYSLSTLTSCPHPFHFLQQGLKFISFPIERRDGGNDGGRLAEVEISKSMRLCNQEVELYEESNIPITCFKPRALKNVLK